MKKNKVTASVYISLSLAMMFWGLSFVWYRLALQHFRPITLVLLRLVISFPILYVIAIVLRRLNRIHRKDIPKFLIISLFEPFLYFVGESYGMLHASPSVAAILIATIPLFTVLFAYLFLKENLTMNNYLGMIVSFVGVVGVVLSDTIDYNTSWKGVLLILIPVFSGVGYGFLLKPLAHKYSSLTIVATQNLIGAIYFLPLFLIIDYPQLDWSGYTFDHFKALLYLAVFASTFAYIGFIQGMRAIGLSKATIFTNFVPVFTAIFAFYVLNEPFTTTKIAGIVLAIVGLLMAQANGKKRK